MLLGSLLGHLCHGVDLASLVLVFAVKFGVMLCQLAEGLTRGRLDLERLNFLEDISTVHSLDDSVGVTNHLLFKDLCILRKHVFLGWLASHRMLNCA